MCEIRAREISANMADSINDAPRGRSLVLLVVSALNLGAGKDFNERKQIKARAKKTRRRFLLQSPRQKKLDLGDPYTVNASRIIAPAKAAKKALSSSMPICVDDSSDLDRRKTR